MHNPFDQVGFGSIAGIRVFESPDSPRYQLPAEVIPGVPWPPGFREDINAWALSFLGTVNTLPRGTVMMMPGSGFAMMRPEDLVLLRNACG